MTGQSAVHEAAASLPPGHGYPIVLSTVLSRQYTVGGGQRPPCASESFLFLQVGSGDDRRRAAIPGVPSGEGMGTCQPCNEHQLPQLWRPHTQPLRVCGRQKISRAHRSNRCALVFRRDSNGQCRDSAESPHDTTNLVQLHWGGRDEGTSRPPRRSTKPRLYLDYLSNLDARRSGHHHRLDPLES